MKKLVSNNDTLRCGVLRAGEVKTKERVLANCRRKSRGATGVRHAMRDINPKADTDEMGDHQHGSAAAGRGNRDRPAPPQQQLNVCQLIAPYITALTE